jgi:hypothetical protein
MGRTMTRVRFGLIAVVLGVEAFAALQPLSAQQSPNLMPGQRVRVTAPSAGMNDAIATVEALSAHDITLRRERLGHGGTDTLQMVPLDSVSFLQVSHRHGHAGTGALIGFGVGAIGGVMEVARENAQARTNFLKFSPLVGALFGLPGAGIGALLGVFVRTEEWVIVDLLRFRIGLVPLSAQSLLPMPLAQRLRVTGPRAGSAGFLGEFTAVHGDTLLVHALPGDSLAFFLISQIQTVEVSRGRNVVPAVVFGAVGAVAGAVVGGLMVGQQRARGRSLGLLVGGVGGFVVGSALGKESWEPLNRRDDVRVGILVTPGGRLGLGASLAL